MFCKHCGKPIEEDSTFCTYCGKEITQEAPTNTPQAAAPKKFDLKIMVIILLLAVITGVGFFYWQSQNSDELTGRTINIYDIIGAKATMTKADDKEYAAQKGLRLGADYGVSTGDVTYVYLNLDDKSLAKLDETSKVNVAQISDNKLRLDLASGSILINEREKSQGDLEIHSGNTVLGIRGTFVTAKYDGAGMTVFIIDGAIDVTTETGEVTPAGARKRVAISGDTVIVDDLRWSMIDNFTRDCILEYEDDLKGVLSKDDFNAIMGNSADYTVGDIIAFGGYNWRVLAVESGRALILSENILEVKAYNDDYQGVTWESCDLRHYLNGEFYNRISTAEQNRIAETRLINSNNQWFDAYGGSNDTWDKIFLLSLEEVVRYFGDSGQLWNQPRSDMSYVIDIYSIDDQYNSARIATYNGEATWWWLRSPGNYSLLAAFVDDDGLVCVAGYGVYDNDGGVRPALWLNL